jgi:hypothetical protein
MSAIVVAFGSGAGVTLARVVVQFVRNRRSDITIDLSRDRQDGLRRSAISRLGRPSSTACRREQL